MVRMLEELNNKIRYKKEYIGNDTYRLFIKKNELDFLEKELKRLKSIDNAKPSEALKCVNVLKEDGCITTLIQGKALETIRQVLLKQAQFDKAHEEFKGLDIDTIVSLYKKEIVTDILCKEIEKQKNILSIIKEKPFESATTINYIQINKDNPKMLDYEHYIMSVKAPLSKEDFERLVRYITNGKNK